MAHNFNQSYHDGPASFSSDRKTVYVTKTETKDGKKEGRKMQTYLLKIFSAKIEKGKKLRYKPFFLNSNQYSVAHPTLSADNSKIVFSSDMPGGFGGSDLYQCTWEDGKWSDPVNLGDSINTTGDEVFPYLANDSVLFFSSNGHLGFGGLDIYKTDLMIDGWSGPENLKKPLNSSYDDFGIILKENMKEGLFSSNRPGGKGSDDIYAFRNMESDKSLEAKELARKLMVHGFVKDMGTMKPLEKATVFILNSSNDEVLILKTDENGYYETLVDHDIPFVAKAMKNGYIHDCTAFRTPAGMEVKKFKVPRDLLLGKIKINQVFKVENIYYDLDKWFIREDLVSQESFNPDIFQHGDKISAKTFGANFFDKCLNNKLKVRFPKPVSYQPTPSAKEVKKVAPTSRPAAMIIKPVVTPVQKGNYRIQIFVTSKELFALCLAQPKQWKQESLFRLR
ncbi:MAG: PD40 domain-containing protein [Prolixibacteraceae bacterium]|nr:PD40 domain-containing protein [Prolixibacteraceae bacterium]